MFVDVLTSALLYRTVTSPMPINRYAYIFYNPFVTFRLTLFYGRFVLPFPTLQQFFIHKNHLSNPFRVGVPFTFQPFLPKTTCSNITAPRKTNQKFLPPSLTVNFPPGNRIPGGTVAQKRVRGLRTCRVFCEGRPYGVCIPGVSCYVTGGVCVI